MNSMNDDFYTEEEPKQEPVYNEPPKRKNESPKRKNDRSQRLYKAEKRGEISGVCVGLADYFDLDVAIVRLIFVVGALMSTGVPFVLIYIVLAIVLDDERELFPERYDSRGNYLG